MGGIGVNVAKTGTLKIDKPKGTQMECEWGRDVKKGTLPAQGFVIAVDADVKVQPPL